MMFEQRAIGGLSIFDLIADSMGTRGRLRKANADTEAVE